MAQQYLPEITEGDKRILLVNGEAVPYCLARVPLAGESRGNLAAGGAGRVQPLTERDQWIASRVGPTLKERGLYFVGLDVIGDFLTEINVTSPTCLREIAVRDQPRYRWPVTRWPAGQRHIFLIGCGPLTSAVLRVNRPPATVLSIGIHPVVIFGFLVSPSSNSAPGVTDRTVAILPAPRETAPAAGTTCELAIVRTWQFRR